MVRSLLTAVLSVWLTVALVLCPYSCMHFPRGPQQDQAATKACCGCGCSSSAAETPEDDSRDGRPSKKSCSCLCICKGALSELPGQICAADLESPEWGPIALETGRRPTLLFDAMCPAPPEPPPPKLPTGREIRALLASLLL